MSRESASLFLFLDTNIHASAFSSPKQTILHRHRNEINTVNQLQLNYSTNVHLLIPQFMKSLCVITIQLNTPTDVPYQMMVDGTFVYVCENLWKTQRGHSNILNNGRVYITRSVIMRVFSCGPRRPRYNGVAVYCFLLFEVKTLKGTDKVYSNHFAVLYW